MYRSEKCGDVDRQVVNLVSHGRVKVASSTSQKNCDFSIVQECSKPVGDDWFEFVWGTLWCPFLVARSSVGHFSLVWLVLWFGRARAPASSGFIGVPRSARTMCRTFQPTIESEKVSHLFSHLLCYKSDVSSELCELSTSTSTALWSRTARVVYVATRSKGTVPPWTVHIL